MRPRAVLFDAGNTLLALDLSRLAREVRARVGVPVDCAGLEAAAAAATEWLERADLTDHERASRYLEALFQLAGVPTSAMTAVRDCLFEMHRERHLWSDVAPDTAPALDRLAREGLRLGVVSNSDGRCEEALEAVGLRDRFEVVIDSRVVGVEKPDPRIFHLALEAMALAPGDALYVGDIYAVDVAGARAAGLEAILLDPYARHRGRDVRTAPSAAAAAELILSGIGPRRPAPLPAQL